MGLRTFSTFAGSASLALLVAFTAVIVSCEKMNVEADGESTPTATANLILKVVGSGQTRGSLAAGASPAISTTMVDFGNTRSGDDYWSRLHFVFYQEGTKVADRSQNVGDDGYGEVAMTLSEGTYQVLVLAHSSNGAPTLATPDKLQFTNAMGFSDTFYYYGDVTVTAEPQTHEIVLTRVTAMVRFIINDDMPQNVRSMKFYYTGGSGTLDARTGLGCVASKQSVVVDVDPSKLSKPYTFDLYTIPRETTAELSLTVTAYDEIGAMVRERTFKSVEVERNKITEFAGDFFGGSTQTPGSETFLVSAETEWGGTISRTY